MFKLVYQKVAYGDLEHNSLELHRSCMQLHDPHREPTNLCNWGKESLKNSGLQRDSNPWPPRIPVRCSTNWVMKPHLGSQAIFRGFYLSHEENRWKNKWNKLVGSRWGSWNCLLLSAVQNNFTVHVYLWVIINLLEWFQCLDHHEIIQCRSDYSATAIGWFDMIALALDIVL